MYVNGTYVGAHEGGHSPFSFDITDALVNGEQEVAVWVNDPLEDESMPRGKQYWKIQGAGDLVHPFHGDLAVGLARAGPRLSDRFGAVHPRVDSGRVRYRFVLWETGRARR